MTSTQYMIPTNEEFVESIAKSIAFNRLFAETDSVLRSVIGKDIDKLVKLGGLESAVDQIFTQLWNGDSEEDEFQREQYIQDAKAAISAINLKLLTMT